MYVVIFQLNFPLQGMSKNDAQKRFPALFQRLEQLEKRIKGGCSAVIALIHKSRFVKKNFDIS